MSERRGLRSSLKGRGRDLTKVLHTGDKGLSLGFRLVQWTGERMQTEQVMARGGPVQGAVQSSSSPASENKELLYRSLRIPGKKNHLKVMK